MGSLALLAWHGDTTSSPMELEYTLTGCLQATNVTLGDSHETATLHDVIGTLCNLGAT